MVRVPRLGAIEFGVPDANAEYAIAEKFNKKPLFLDAYIAPPLSDIEKFKRGEKFLVLGLKGTGKTAVLRDLQKTANDFRRVTEFLIFRNEILEEKDLVSFDWPLLIDDEKIKSMKHYLHCIKRILLSIILKMCLTSQKIENIEKFQDDDESFFKRFSRRILDSPKAQIVQVAFDSILSLIKSTQVDVSKLSNDKISIDVARLMKRQNDILLHNVCQIIKSSGTKLSLFVDEIHFAYRDEETLRQDAMLGSVYKMAKRRHLRMAAR